MKTGIFILIILVQISAATGVIAETNIQYVPLEPLPGFSLRTDIETGKSSFYFSDYLQWVLSFGISLAGIFAVLMIVIGGIQHVVAYGNPGQIENAKNRIFQALLGLLLAIAAWLILYTINPDLIKGGLNIPSFKPPTPSQSQLQTTQSQQDPCKGFICNTISQTTCNEVGGTILTPCEQYCPNTKGLCGGTYVCCKR